MFPMQQQSEFRLCHLLLAHSASFIKFTYVVVSLKIFSVRLFFPLPAALGGNCFPLLPLVTP